MTTMQDFGLAVIYECYSKMNIRISLYCSARFSSWVGYRSWMPMGKVRVQSEHFEATALADVAADVDAVVSLESHS